LNSLQFQCNMYDLETANLRQSIRDATSEAEVREIGLRLEEVKSELKILQDRVNFVESLIRERLY